MIQKGSISPFTKWLISSLTILPSILCVIGTQPPSPPPPPALNFTDQRLAVVYPVIQTFKNTITSDPLGITRTWVGPDICNYTGFYCDNPPDNLSAIALASVDFNGYQLGAPTLDGFIDQLPDLALFHANSNNFTGTISTKIANLRYFYELDISNNKFLGPFPEAVLTAGLLFLDIRFNFFTGMVPPQIFAQPLSVLFINNNRFTQRLPENFGNIPALYLTFAYNGFTGPIPASIGNASRLTEILFLNNLLTGCIPIEIGFLKNATVFDAGNNLLTGPLPYSLGCLENIERLNLAGNFLFGEVPEIVCELGNLKNLSLSNNYFSVVGPRCWKLIKSGVLDLRNNCIHGLPDQRPFVECWWFFFFPIHSHCQYPWWFTTHVPCFAHHKKHHPPNGSKRKLLSYAALSRNRVFEDQRERIVPF